MNNRVLIIGTGLGALTAALRLARRGYKVQMVEKHHQPGGRLNQIKKDGFTFDIGPTFFSMTYEFEEFIRDAQIKMPFKFKTLDSLYEVNYRENGKNFSIHKDLDKLAKEFERIEPGFKEKMQRFLDNGGRFFHDVENKILKRNYNSLWSYFMAMATVPPKHAPLLYRTVWSELERYFDSREVKEIFSLVAFFLGNTPFDTPAIYTLLSYTELVHDGYHNVEGGMYKIVEGLMSEIKKKNIEVHYNTEIVSYQKENGKVKSFTDQHDKEWNADIFLVNSDAALFRHKVFKRPSFSEKKLEKMKWTLAPLSIYLGLNTKLNNVSLHNYFLGDNFKEYAGQIFKNAIKFEKPYYYVNVVSQSNPSSAPEGHESLFILCPMPDMRFKPDWSDKQKIANDIVTDLSKRINVDLRKHIVSETIMTPEDWENTFNLYKGSGLSLGHNLSQIGAFRPKNFDEKHKNVFYVGSSTLPGTGLPMAVISSKLAVERITEKYGFIHQ